MREIVITPADAGGRFDKYLLKSMPNATKAFIYKMLRKKNIALNNKKAVGNELLASGDTVTLFLSEETISKFTAKKKPSAVSGRLNIIFEDENVIIINKPAGLLAQADSSSGKGLDSILTRLNAYLGEEARPALANRLDRNTSGLIMCGKNTAAVRALNTGIRDKAIRKLYLAAAAGIIEQPVEIISGYIKDNDANKASVADKGKEVITRVNPLAHAIDCALKPYKGYSLLTIEPVTGKSHQIRLHLKHKGHPILGDAKYGDDTANNALFAKTGIRLRAQCLHAHMLMFDTTGFLSYLRTKTFTAPPPSPFADIIEKLFNSAVLT